MSTLLRHVVFRQHEIGFQGELIVSIEVSGTALPNLNKEHLKTIFSDAGEKVKQEVLAEIIKNNPVEAEKIVDERKKLLASFGDRAIYVEQIQNKYCGDYCCRHRPWYRVTTAIGVFEIGWRKRVIVLDWSSTRCTKKAEELFAFENTTKDGNVIHAWGYRELAEYITKVIEFADPSPF